MNTTPIPVSIPKHSCGSYWDHLPRITERERLQKQTLHRFMSQQARYKLMKFSNLLTGLDTQRRQRRKATFSSSDKNRRIEEESRKVLNETKAKADKEDKENDGARKKSTSSKSEPPPPEKSNKWLEEYDEQVAKIFQSPDAEGGNNDGNDEKKPVDMFNLSKSVVIGLQTKSQNEIFTPPISWPAHEGRNVMCHVCRTPCESLTTATTTANAATCHPCPFCSAIAHETCLTAQSSSGAIDPICYDCRYEVDTSHADFIKRRKYFEEKIKKEKCATAIASRWRSRIAVENRKLYKCTTLHIQAFMRSMWMEREFRKKRRRLPRPLIVELARGWNLPSCDWENKTADPYVIITILDKKDRQIWRYDGDPVFGTLDPNFEQRYLIPGCPGTAKVVLTVLDRDELRDQFIGQAFLSLSWSNNNNSEEVNPKEVWQKGGYFRMTLDELRYMPKTTSAADVAVDLGAVDFGSVLPQGDIEMRIVPMDGLRNMCGYVMSSPLDGTLGGGGAGGGAGMDARSKKQLPLSMTKSRKYWCCIANHKLYFYSKFGSSQPKLVLDLNDFTVQFTPNHQMRIISIKEKGKEYKLICPKLNERDRWRTAFTVSYDYVLTNKEGGDWDTRIISLTKKMRRLTNLETAQVIRKRQQTRRESMRATLVNEKKSQVDKK